MMARFVLSAALAAAALAVACGGALPPDTTPRGNAAGANRARATRTTPKARGTYEDENARGMSEERVNKWRWEGDRQECYFVTGNKCFAEAKQACRAARCGRRGCRIDDDGAPARVMCEGDDATGKARAERDAIKARNAKAEGEFDDSKFRKERRKRRFEPGKDGDASSDGEVEEFDEGDDRDADRKKKRKRRRRNKKRGKRR